MKQRQEELEAVKTTIVGGRPPGCGRRDTTIPRGIEVLVKKAAVDEAFCQTLLTRRGEAAGAIGLQLDPAEKAMLGIIPEEHLLRIIRQTVVPTEQRRVFLGPVAAAMLAVLGVGLASCGQDETSPAASKGIRPDIPTTTATAPTPSTVPEMPIAIDGIRPDIPGEAMPSVTQGMRPDLPTTVPGTVPELPSRGIRPDRPPVIDTQPTTSTAPAGDNSPLLMAIKGIRADIPTTTPSTATAPTPSTVPEMLSRGIRPDRPGIDNQPATSTQPAPKTITLPVPQADGLPPEMLQVAGLRIDRPLQLEAPPQLNKAPVHTSTASIAIAAESVEQTVPQTITVPIPPVTSTPPVAVFGVRIDRPPATNTQPATSTAPASQPATQPAFVFEITNPGVAGIRIDRPPATNTQPVTSTAPASQYTFPSEMSAFGALYDRPPATSTQPAPASQPATLPAAVSEPAPPILMNIVGTRIDRPPQPDTQPATQPVSIPPDARDVAGSRSDRPTVGNNPPAPTPVQPIEPPELQVVVGIRVRINQP